LIYTPLPPGILAELEVKTREEPPPTGFGWSIAWDRHGRRTDLDALVPVRSPAVGNQDFPAILIVHPRPERADEWLAASVSDDLAVPGITDRLAAYLGTPHPERDS